MPVEDLRGILLRRARKLHLNHIGSTLINADCALHATGTINDGRMNETVIIGYAAFAIKDDKNNLLVEREREKIKIKLFYKRNCEINSMLYCFAKFY